ncbi:E3 ubiquitin-protein ligase TRIM11-like [Natator depressus]|uniref:E3 ubiquitin-protein ligase TRIM11-like n=1 Tax=Natator depressus TaxID=27790 RepID=UPI003EBEB8BB
MSRGEDETSLHPVPKSPELEKRIWDFPGENNLQEAVTGFLGLRRARGFAVDVTLDPEMDNPQLVLSEDRKPVRYGDTCQDLPDSPERFDTSACVLGSEGFTGGRHFWEVESQLAVPPVRWAVGLRAPAEQRSCERRRPAPVL